MARSNKNSANEDALGTTHGLITRLTNTKLEHMLKMIEDGDLDPDIAINMRDVQVAAKWVEYNEIGALTADKEEDSELKKNLSKIRNKHQGTVVSFMAEEA